MASKNRGPELQRVCIALYVVAFIAVFLRCYVRTQMVKHFGVDDWFMVLAVACFTVFMVCVLLGIHYGTGQHMWDLDPENAKNALKFWWFCSFGYCSTMITSKVSIGCFLLRITNRKIDKWIIYSIISTTVASGFIYFFILMFQCSPISFAWNKDQAGHCLSFKTIMTVTWIYSILNIICDLTFAILPCFLVWNLQMHKRSKIALIPVLTIACVASVAIIIRFAYIGEFSNPDFLWATIPIAIWSTCEQSLAITAGSLATLSPLFRIAASRLGLSTSGSKKSSSSGTRLSHGMQPIEDGGPDGNQPSRLSRAYIKPSKTESSVFDDEYADFDYLSDEHDMAGQPQAPWRVSRGSSSSDEESNIGSNQPRGGPRLSTIGTL